ncbi:hypothetical protein BJ138DRAFT_1088773 [Hygrophoropsis aurantiaca]|uniref:Uncharacterized protein n=1 Tax=Hygrophoropsis aurantiaca TaxID=72124 RepID=A0ACB8A964_9AGAM|nr:hypothetical protein BJ138DRAFT_1088773 [Hygrophoropsis aurantiaca]
MSAKHIEIAGQDIIWSITFTDANHIVARDNLVGIRRWSIVDGQQKGPIMQTSSAAIATALSPDGQRIVTGDWGNKVIVWNAATHAKVLEFTEHAGSVNGVDVSSDSTRVVSGSSDRTVRIFSITSGARLISPLLHDAVVAAVKFSPDGNQLATATFQHPTVRVYNARTGDRLFDIPVQVTGFPIAPFVWSPDGQKLFASSPGRASYTPSTSEQWSIIHNTNSQPSVATNGRFIACYAGSTLWFWDSISHEQIGNVIQHNAEIRSIALSPDERYLACGNGTKITVYSLRNILPPHYFNDATNNRPPAPHFPNGTYRIKSNTGNAYLAAQQAGNVTVVAKPSDAQIWTISHVGNGAFGIMGPNNASLSVGNANALVCVPNGRPTTWTIEPRGIPYVIGNVANTTVIRLNQNRVSQFTFCCWWSFSNILLRSRFSLATTMSTNVGSSNVLRLKSSQRPDQTGTLLIWKWAKVR